MNSSFDFLNLIDAYSEPHRHFHNFNHIAQMFEWAKEYEIGLSDEQKLAILFHDVVYQTDEKSENNEKESAECAYSYCIDKYGEEFAKIVKQIILDTKEHIPTIELSKDVLDLDLLGLAFKESYETGSRNIKMEFQHCNYEEFNKGRIKWIESMLNRKQIFTGFFSKNGCYERYARHNLENELRQRKRQCT